MAGDVQVMQPINRSVGRHHQLRLTPNPALESYSASFMGTSRKDSAENADYPVDLFSPIL